MFDESQEATVSRSLAGDDQPTDAVVEAAADVTGHSPLEMEPLFERVDTDALNALFDGTRTAGTTVTFEYAGCAVTVTDGAVRTELLGE